MTATINSAQANTRRTGTSDGRTPPQVRVPYIRVVPGEVVVHLGPTNSGKTFESLNELAIAGRGIYVSPLRMLAQEVFERLTAMCGPHSVGLLTGDQVIRSDAPILCCTAEMAPLDAPFAVIDEAHWIDDAERGKAWTRLLTQGRYDRLSIIAAPEAEGFLHKLYPGMVTVRHDRLSDLQWDSRVTAASIARGSVVVAFSRSAVFALARDIHQHSGLVTSVLYGSLPASVRLDQIDRFLDGRIDVLIATDSIGHGVNLPTDTIVFAETEKFDGRTLRPLHTWEAAQIAGRAGRGAGRDGRVQALVGQVGLSANAHLLIEAVEVAAGRFGSDLLVSKAPIGPGLDDLCAAGSADLRGQLVAWRTAAGVELADHTWARPASTATAEKRLTDLHNVWGGTWPLDAETTWALATAPMSSPPAIEFASRALVDPRFDIAEALQVDRIATADLLTAERLAGTARDLVVAVRTFGPLGGLGLGALTEIMQEAEARVAGLLDNEIATNTFGRCKRCAVAIAPRFSICDGCWSKVRARKSDRSSKRRAPRQSLGQTRRSTAT